MVKGRRVAVAVGGGIAAVRAGDVVRELRRQGATVRVAMTKAAAELVTPLAMQSLSGEPVLTDIFDPAQDKSFGHLQVSRWAELFVVVPATASLIGRIRAGLGDDAVTTTLLAFRGPVLLAPAMNTAMWENEQVQENVRALSQVPRFRLVGPVAGPLADGDVGMGRLAEVADIVAQAGAALAPRVLAGQRVLITAGPTREYFDPVRYISSPSTGKMGLAVAAAAHGRGADVTVVLGPSSEPVPAGVELVRVTSAEEMHAAVLQRLDACDVFIASAAVSDYRPAQVEALKTKKSDGPTKLELIRTPDVLASASARAHTLQRRPLLVGFAAETNDVLTYARGKRTAKRLDAIVANQVGAPGAGFGGDTNAVTVISPSGAEVALSGSKREVAEALISMTAEWLSAHRGEDVSHA